MIAVGLAGLLALAGPAATPAATAEGGPVRVDADSVHYAFQRHEVVFSGKPVVLTRDDARLTCAKLVAHNDEAGQIVTATCRGDVRLVRGTRTVTCDAATYDNGGPTITCEGNAVLRDGGAEARGVRLVYELRTDEVRLEGGAAPVQITLPGDEVDARRKELEQQRKARREGER